MLNATNLVQIGMTTYEIISNDLLNAQPRFSRGYALIVICYYLQY